MFEQLIIANRHRVRASTSRHTILTKQIPFGMLAASVSRSRVSVAGLGAKASYLAVVRSIADHSESIVVDKDKHLARRGKLWREFSQRSNGSLGAERAADASERVSRLTGWANARKRRYRYCNAACFIRCTMFDDSKRHAETANEWSPSLQGWSRSSQFGSMPQHMPQVRATPPASSLAVSSPCA
jgi:hypothetical protein